MRAVKKVIRTTPVRVIARAMKVVVVRSGVMYVAWGNSGGFHDIGR